MSQFIPVANGFPGIFCSSEVTYPDWFLMRCNEVQEQNHLQYIIRIYVNDIGQLFGQCTQFTQFVWSHQLPLQLFLSIIHDSYPLPACWNTNHLNSMRVPMQTNAHILDSLQQQKRLPLSLQAQQIFSILHHSCFYVTKTLREFWFVWLNSEIKKQTFREMT